MESRHHVAIYDFELLPYALGDVLTWNIQTALRCEDMGLQKVDMFICMDPRHPASIYQRNLVVSENCSLFLNELFGAFGTHPTLGNIHLFGSRDEMLVALKEAASKDSIVAGSLSDYEKVLASRDNEAALNEYFIKYVYSHETINAFARKHGHIPLLAASRGCEPDVTSLINQRFAGKRIVVIHPRLRRLDYGYGGEHTYQRDSDIVEWHEFVRLAGNKHPDVQFVLVGRLQEKPLELLRLPNVVSLRMLGMGIGHELTLMLQADLFLGASSGFAAMANFSAIPYFITKMNREACKAYGIEEGSDRLPFAKPDQVLIYEPETSVLLMQLLEKQLQHAPRHSQLSVQTRDVGLHPDAFSRTRSQGLHPNATTTRFFADDSSADQETAFLIWPKIEEALDSFRRGEPTVAAATATRLKGVFPRLGERLPQLGTLVEGTARPSRIRPHLRRLRRLIEKANVNVLPRFLHGTIVHRATRHMKHRLLGYRLR
jgi:hypothetical protein